MFFHHRFFQVLRAGGTRVNGVHDRLTNVGMNIFDDPNLLIQDVFILSAACGMFWVGGYFSFRVQTYVR